MANKKTKTIGRFFMDESKIANFAKTLRKQYQHVSLQAVYHGETITAIWNVC